MPVQPDHRGDRLPLLRDARLVRPLPRNAARVRHSCTHQHQFWSRQCQLPAGRPRPGQLRTGVRVVPYILLVLFPIFTWRA